MQDAFKIHIDHIFRKSATLRFAYGFSCITILLSMLITSGCVTTGKAPGQYLSGYARTLAWTPDGNAIVAIRHHQLEILDARTLKIIKRHQTNEPLHFSKLPSTIAFTPDGRYFATAGFGGGIWIFTASTWDIETGIPHSENDTAIAFTPDGKYLITAGPESPLRLWEVETWSHPETLVDAPSGITSVAVSPDGKLLATGEAAQRISLWNFPERKIARIVKDYAGPVVSVAFSPNSQLLASSAGGYEVRLLRLSDLTERKKIVDPSVRSPETEEFINTVNVISVINMARMLYLTGAPGAMHPVTDINYSGWPVFNCPISFSPDGRYLALIRFSHELSSSYHAEVYEVSTGKRISRFHGAISSVAFSPDGQKLLTDTAWKPVIIDPQTGEEIQSIE